MCVTYGSNQEMFLRKVNKTLGRLDVSSPNQFSLMQTTHERIIHPGENEQQQHQRLLQRRVRVFGLYGLHRGGLLEPDLPACGADEKEQSVLS